MIYLVLKIKWRLKAQLRDLRESIKTCRLDLRARPVKYYIYIYITYINIIIY